MEVTAMTDSVFLKVQGAQVGPVSRNELGVMIKEKKLSPEDFIWDQDSEQWLPTIESELIRQFFIFPEIQDQIIMAIGGAKGGVGKTSITVSLGVLLASLGHKVVIVDADLGGANLHTFMGIEQPSLTFYDFYTSKKKKLQDIVLPTEIENLFIISGSCGTLGLANPKYSQKLRFIKELKKLEADYVLLDLGAGSSYNELDFFLAARQGIVISTPEPASIQEAFFFIKKALLRKLAYIFRNQEKVSSLFDLELGSWNHPEVNSIKELYKEVENVDVESASIFRGVLEKFQPSLILNMAMNSREHKEGIALKTAVAELLSVDLELLGNLPFDNKVRMASMQQKPFVVLNPNSKASKHLSVIATKKIEKITKLKGYLDRKRIMKLLDRLEVQESKMVQDVIICSYRCSYWNDCEYQNGGYPCGIRNLEIGLKSNSLKHETNLEV